jgi:hypothetical protein
MDLGLRIIARGEIFEAARHALTLHQWLTAPNFDQEGEVKQAEASLVTPEARISPLLPAAYWTNAWLDRLRDEVSPPRRAEPGRGRGRPPMIKADVEPPLAPQPPPDPTMTLIERRAIDYSELEQAVGHLEHVIRDTRRVLNTIGRSEIPAPAAMQGRDPTVFNDDATSGDFLDKEPIDEGT